MIKNTGGKYYAMYPEYAFEFIIESHNIQEVYRKDILDP
jgi:hypothetical protein